MKIYTKKGDKGKTSLIGGTRVSKAHIRIESYGTVDELNSHIGIVQSQLDEKDALYGFLAEVQHDLFVMGSLLAADPEKNRMELPSLNTKDVHKIEVEIDQMNEELEPLRAFILPSGHYAVAQCHVARTVCRRSERAVVRLSDLNDDPTTVDPVILEYLNRLSDFLFVLARKVGKDFGVGEVEWQPRSGGN